MGPQIWCMLVAIAVLFALGVIDKIRGIPSRLDARDAWLRQMSNSGIAFLVLCVGLWFFLPSTPSLSTFSMPDGPSDVSTPRDVLKYLQKYNVAIVSLSDTLHWLLFTGVFWIGWSVVTALRVKRAPATTGAASAIDAKAA